MIMISVDDHLVEPPDLFTRHMPAKFRDRAPRVIDHKGKDVWFFEDRIIPFPGLGSVAGRPPEEYGMEPVRFAQMRDGCYLRDARVGDMDANGVLGALCFPTWTDFAGTNYCAAKDKDLALATIQTYNDWHVDEWAGGAPGRFIPLAVVPLWDVGLAVAEAKRLAAKNVHAITFPDNPAARGLPSIHSGYWDPFFKVCSDHKIVLCAHIGTGLPVPIPSDDAPQSSWIVNLPLSIAFAASDWVFSQVFIKFPELKFALSEGGIGWIPYFLERADFTYHHHKAWTRQNTGGKLPSKIFRRNIITCFIDDAFGVESRHKVGVETICWECDYPHSDSTWPRSPEVLWESMKGVPKAEVDLMTHLNAMRDFSFDPFTVLGRENCTVGALRAQAKAKGVDTTPISGRGGIKPSFDDEKVVTCGDVLRQFADAAAA
ncbi:MAG: amidohydrolase 2 [Caulobacter sp.]|nr:amidohydrolase 2 [Caulobacter sp.]